LRGLSLDDLFDIVARHGLHFDKSRQSGVVFDMISCLTERGQVGLYRRGRHPDAAGAIYHRAERTLLGEASIAGRHCPSLTIGCVPQPRSGGQLSSSAPAGPSGSGWTSNVGPSSAPR
jgi:hypothetical protein